jgi:hypothetical protein
MTRLSKHGPIKTAIVAGTIAFSSLFGGCKHEPPQQQQNQDALAERDRLVREIHCAETSRRFEFRTTKGDARKRDQSGIIRPCEGAGPNGEPCETYTLVDGTTINGVTLTRYSWRDTYSFQVNFEVVTDSKENPLLVPYCFVGSRAGLNK